MKSLLILSGGLDSSVSSLMAMEKTTPILALTFDYGQRAAQREMEFSSRLAKRLGVSHQVLELPWLKNLTRTSLVNKQAKLPSLKEKDLENVTKGHQSAKAVWVPNRNGLFLNIGACYAESLEVDFLVTGFNAEEGITFPDNSAAFSRSADDFFWFSTLSKVRVVSYTQSLSKKEIAAKAQALGLSPQDVWFCYEGGQSPCKKCESCLRTFRAFRTLEQ